MQTLPLLIANQMTYVLIALAIVAVPPSGPGVTDSSDSEALESTGSSLASTSIVTCVSSCTVCESGRAIGRG